MLKPWGLKSLKNYFVWWEIFRGHPDYIMPRLKEKKNKKHLSKYAENVSHSTDVKNCTYFHGTQQLHFVCCSEISRYSKNLMMVFTQYVYRDKGNIFFLIVLIKIYQCRNMSTDFSNGRAMPVLNSIFVNTLFPPQKKHVFFKVYCCFEEYFWYTTYISYKH